MADASPSELPSATLYLQNLNEKTKKGALKAALLHLCAAWGSVKEIHVTRA